MLSTYYNASSGVASMSHKCLVQLLRRGICPHVATRVRNLQARCLAAGAAAEQQTAAVAGAATNAQATIDCGVPEMLKHLEGAVGPLSQTPMVRTMHVIAAMHQGVT
jgi:hypothetical protein